MVGRDKTGRTAIKQRGREIVTVNACFGGNSLSREPCVGEFTGRWVEATEGITGTTKSLGKTSKRGKRGQMGGKRW